MQRLSRFSLQADMCMSTLTPAMAGSCIYSYSIQQSTHISHNSGGNILYLARKRGFAIATSALNQFNTEDKKAQKKEERRAENSKRPNFIALLKDASRMRNTSRAVLAADSALQAKALRRLDCAPVMKIYKLAGKPDRCNAVLEYMIKCKMSVDRETYLPVVSSYGSAGDYAQASRLFEESRELKGRNKRPQLYSAMIGACANARDGSKWMEAIGLFEEMRQNDILITASNHNAVIGALVKGERYAAAKEWYKQLEPMQKTRVVFSIMSKASMETDDLDLARSILKEATGHADEAFKKAVAARVLMNYPITDVYNAVLSIYLNRRDIDKAMGLFEKMNTHKYKSTATPNSQTYSILLVYSANELLWDDLISAAQMARANFSYILPYAYKHAVSACKEHHRDDLVIKLDLEMHKMSADARERRRRDQLQSSR